MNEDQRCKTCKWWGTDPEISRGEEYKNGKACAHPKNRFAPRSKTIEEDRFLVDEDTDEPRPDDAGNVLDGSGYWGVFCPGPDFGCIHWEKKDN